VTAHRGIGPARRLSGIALVLLALVGAGVADCAPAAAQTFLPIGSEQTFTVPSGVESVQVVAVGGHGGSAGSIGGGAPATVSAVLPVTPGQLLYVEVGDNGEAAANGGAGGFNGGGASGGADAAGGGGASDLRILPRTSGLSPDSRLIVAAGGGGAAEGAGGDAGSDGAIGNAPGEGGGAGTATGGGPHGTSTCSAGAGDGEDGQLGLGGKGGTSNTKPNSGAGGGGGGYYGGGGGGAGCMSGGGGGGGGSSLVSSSASNASVSIDPAAAPVIEITPILPMSAAPPSNLFRFGRLRLNKKKGTATLAVKLPDPGILTLRGKGIVARRLGFAGAGVSRSLGGQGSVKLRIKPKGASLRKLERTGRVKVKAIVTFAPRGGTPKTRKRPIGLKKKL
jgi:hypothetical protein